MYDRKVLPDHIYEVVRLLQGPDRELLVAGTSLLAGEVLGQSWEQYDDDVIRKMGYHIVICDRAGVQQGLWQLALSGLTYGWGWFPNPWWQPAVGLLRAAVEENRLEDVYPRPEAMADAPMPEGEEFWTALATHPNTINGRQAAWVQRTQLEWGDLLHDLRDADRQRLGSLDFAESFSMALAIF